MRVELEGFKLEDRVTTSQIIWVGTIKRFWSRDGVTWRVEVIWDNYSVTHERVSNLTKHF